MSAEHIETAHLVDETPVPPVNDPVMMTDESALPASDDVQPLEAVDENQGVSGETVVSDAEQPSPQDPPDDNESSSSSQDDGTVSSTNEGVRREANEHEEVPSEGGEATADSPNKLHRPRTPTRARGSSGIPPKTKLQLEDLRDLPKEEIARALYEDPELAQQAAAAAAQREELKPPVTQPTVKPKQQKRKAQVPSTKTTREELLKDRGFPVFQWIVLSLLAGLLAYQLIKSFQAAPPKKSTAGKTHKTASSAKARDTKESRSKKNSGKSDPAKKKGTSAENSQSTSAEKVAENTAHTPESTIAAETVEINKKETKKKKSKSEKKVPLLVDGKQNETKPNTETVDAPRSAAHVAPAHTLVQEDEGKWKTVATKANSKIIAPAVTPSDNNLIVKGGVNKDSLAMAGDNDKLHNNGAKIATNGTDENALPDNHETLLPGTMDGVESVDVIDDGQKKKKSKKKQKNNGAIAKQHDGTNDHASATGGDAAFALELQQMEERAAKEARNQDEYIAGQVTNETALLVNWEEVKTKKRRAKIES